MKKTLTLMLTLLIAFSLLSVLLVSCSTKKSPLDPKKPTTITLWHNYGGEMMETMIRLIDSFNSGIGKEQGIIVRVDAVSSSSELAKNLDLIIDENPAAPDMPNITVSYPKTAVKFAEKNLLSNLSDYFTKEKTDLYITDFITEGKINDALYVFPVAKSTEVLFLNQTLFDRFAAETGVSIDSLATFEGICDTSLKYHKWCGKAFFTADSWFNLFSVALQQSGDDFIKNQNLQTESATFQNLNSKFVEAINQGGIKIYDGYSSDLAQTGDIICSIGSTAGILFYGDKITYPDNTSEKVEYTILPYPTIENGKKIALQRGNGMIVKKASEAEELASAIFLEWLTQPEQNLQFISNTGYFPVTKEAFSNLASETIPQIDNANIKKLLTVAVEMQNSYTFYVPPVYDNFDSQSKEFEKNFKIKE